MGRLPDVNPSTGLLSGKVLLAFPALAAKCMPETSARMVGKIAQYIALGRSGMGWRTLVPDFRNGRRIMAVPDAVSLITDRIL
jgi:hypothetical protein